MEIVIRYSLFVIRRKTLYFVTSSPNHFVTLSPHHCLHEEQLTDTLIHIYPANNSAVGMTLILSHSSFSGIVSVTTSSVSLELRILSYAFPERTA